MKDAEKKSLDSLLARAIHRTATPFGFFDNPYWKEFLAHLRPSYRLPSRDVIGGRMLVDEYERVQVDASRAVMKFPVFCFTLDGATSKAGKQVLNVLACGPMAYFIEHFDMNLQRESSKNLFSKLLSCQKRLRLLMKNAIPESEVQIELDECDDNDDDVWWTDCHDMRMWNLCTDSPNVMKALRKRLWIAISSCLGMAVLLTD